MKTSTKAILVVLVLGLVGYWFKKHSGFFLWNQQPLQYMPNMHRTEALKPQRGFDFYSNFSSSLVPPQGTVSREVKPYKFKGPEHLAESVDKFANPLPRTKEVVLRGKLMFESNCYVCHGKDGNGNGPVVGPFANPPTLNSDKVREYADSQVFHVITNGQNTMGAYGAQIRERDRWAIVHYVRVLQLADRPRVADLEAFDAIVKKETP